MFVSSEHSLLMDSVSLAFRRRKGWSQGYLATRLGVTSRGYISDLESGRQPWPLKLAVRYQLVSEGEVAAADLCPDAAALLEERPAEAAAQS